MEKLRKIISALILLLLFAQTLNAGNDRRAQVRSSEGNSAKLLPTGKEFYDDLIAAVDSAKQFICAEYYTIGTDSIGTVFLSRLAQKAAEGVQVYVMIDGYGSFCTNIHPMDKGAMQEWKENGLDINVFNRMTILQPFPRNHRKLAIVDGRVAFVGGMNIRDQYIKGSEELGEVNDLTVRLEGPVSRELVKVFRSDWHFWNDRKKLGIEEEETEPLPAGDISIDILPTLGAMARPTVREHYVRIINSADKSIRIVNGYFMPSAPIVAALRRAAARNVQVDILMGATTDLPSLLYQQPFKAAKRLDKLDNIDLYIYDAGFFHEKAMSIDGKDLLVGSTNLDLLSRLINLELSVFIHDEEITKQYDAIFDANCHKEQ